MDKIQIIKQFNHIIESLLDQVAPLIGTKYANYFRKLVKINALVPIQNFSIYALKHKDQIMEKDPDYFLNEDTYKNTVKEIYGESTDWCLHEILYLKTIYVTVDNESKENIWSILQALVILSEDYIILN